MAITGTGAVCFGSVSHALGQLAAMLERWGEAADHYEKALEGNAGLGARLFLANTQIAYARMLCQRAEPEDEGRARELIDEALSTCRELQLANLEGKALRVRKRLDLEEVG
jgi:hypothetical protein